jgi:hypothetical protein
VSLRERNSISDLGCEEIPLLFFDSSQKTGAEGKGMAQGEARTPTLNRKDTAEELEVT